MFQAKTSVYVPSQNTSPEQMSIFIPKVNQISEKSLINKSILTNRNTFIDMV